MRFALVALALAACTERSLGAGEPSLLDASAVVDMMSSDLRHSPGDLAHVCPPRQCTADAGSVCPSSTGLLEVDPGAVQARFCGQLIDGSVEIVVSNFSAQSHVLELQQVSYFNSALSLGYADGSAKLTRAYSCAGEPDPWDGTVVAGAVDQLRIAQHFSIGDQPVAGTYTIIVVALTDGQSVNYELGDYPLAQDPTCN
jgi:hypothetical protein